MTKLWLNLLVMTVAGLVTVGTLSAQEAKKQGAADWQARLEAQFKKMDADGDGCVCCEEFVGKRKKAEQVEQAKEIFKLCDKDGDGKMSMDEFKKKPVEARFKALDRNADGEVTIDDFKSPKAKPEQAEKAEQRFKQLDKDGDGKVTLEEFKAAHPTPKKAAKKGAGKKRGKKKKQD